MLQAEIPRPQPKIENLTTEMYSAYLKPIKRCLIHHSMAIGPKVNFPDVFWRPSWIYADYESCPKLPSWQQS